MIIVRIWEGLGNQFFQYAYAKSLSLRTNNTVCLDIRHPNRGDICGENFDVHRISSLKRYDITLPAINTKNHHVFDFLEGGARGKNVKMECAKRGWYPIKFLTDEGQTANVLYDILEPRPFTYISGHFLNRKYYEDIKECLCNEMRLKDAIILEDSLKEIYSYDNLVSVHVRRTDYLGYYWFLDYEEYYERAIKIMQEKVRNPMFLFFSDDIDWVRRNVNCKENYYFISGRNYDACQELELMRRCHHHIIANSTFSYWGAWQGQNEEKVVVAPRRWLTHLYDKDWIMI